MQRVVLLSGCRNAKSHTYITYIADGVFGKSQYIQDLWCQDESWEGDPQGLSAFFIINLVNEPGTLIALRYLKTPNSYISIIMLIAINLIVKYGSIISQKGKFFSCSFIYFPYFFYLIIAPGLPCILDRSANDTANFAGSLLDIRKNRVYNDGVV